MDHGRDSPSFVSPSFWTFPLYVAWCVTPSAEIREYFTKPHPPGKLWLPLPGLRSCPASPVPGDERNRGPPSGVCRSSGREACLATFSGRGRSTLRRTPAPPCAPTLEV